MFEEWGLLGNTVILLVSLFILDRASDLMVDNAVKVAGISGLGKTTVGFLLIAMSTTLPELSVSVFASIDGKGIGVAIGNALGSNVVNSGLILGIAFLIASLRSPKDVKDPNTVAKEELGTLHFGLFIASVIPLVLLFIGEVSRIIGLVLIGIFILHVYRLSRTKRMSGEWIDWKNRKRLRVYALLVFIGAIMVVASARLLVDSVVNIAASLGVPGVVIGATIVAFGTSLPEFVHSVKSSRRGHLDLAMGNIVGSNFIDTTLILGVALVGSPFSVEMNHFRNLVIFSLAANLLLWYFILSERISWKTGVILFIVYILFLAT
ncbi:MAG: sodium:calcium antiporter, partial [Candidatus Bathyarchaeia archaeon]